MCVTKKSRRCKPKILELSHRKKRRGASMTWTRKKSKSFDMSSRRKLKKSKMRLSEKNQSKETTLSGRRTS